MTRSSKPYSRRVGRIAVRHVAVVCALVAVAASSACLLTTPLDGFDDRYDSSPSPDSTPNDGHFWATEQPNAVYLVEPADRFAKLVYLLANPFADHLVDRISDWPGACSLGMQPVGDDEISEAAEGVLSVQRQDAQRRHAPYRAARRLRGAVGGGVGGEAPRGPEPRGRAHAKSEKQAVVVCSDARPSSALSRRIRPRRSNRGVSFGPTSHASTRGDDSASSPLSSRSVHDAWPRSSATSQAVATLSFLTAPIAFAAAFSLCQSRSPRALDSGERPAPIQRDG